MHKNIINRGIALSDLKFAYLTLNVVTYTHDNSWLTEHPLMSFVTLGSNAHRAITCLTLSPNQAMATRYLERLLQTDLQQPECQC